MRRLASLLLAFLVLLTSAGSATADPVDGRIDAICRRHIRDPKGPGAAVAVVRDGRVIHKACYGMADVSRQQPITPQTCFDLASVSKQFTATCVMLLADRGKLSFEDDVRRFFPDFPVYSKKRPVRVEDLLQMKSGLAEYDDDQTGWTARTLVAFYRKEPLEAPTGTKYAYTNANYVLLGYIVEQLSGRTMRDFLQQNVFTPLGMTRTTFFQDAAHPPARAMGYKKAGRGFERSRHDVPGTADGNIFSCLDDMLVWEAALRRAALVRPATLQRARTRARLDNGRTIDYGYGWEISPKKADSRYIEHSGAWYGASSYILLDLDTRESIIVLSNIEDLAPDLADKIWNR